jgi:hypothetical protein
MADRLFPDDDAGILAAVMTFATGVAANPNKYFLYKNDAELLVRVANEYKDAYFAAKDKSTRTEAAVCLKNQTQTSAMQAIRGYANMIRASAGVSDAAKIEIGVMPPKGTLSRRTCPQSEPLLKFHGTVPGMHQISISDSSTPNSRRKPFCAVRCELFMMMTDPAEPVPMAFDEDASGSKYLRSYTRSRLQIAHPQPVKPMLITYFARWADSTGETGPFSLALPTTIVCRCAAAPDSSPAASLEAKSDSTVPTSIPAKQPKLKRAA